MANPVFKAIKPASLPITSTKNNLWWEIAVSLILSIASVAVLRAVSYPKVWEVPKRSLSIVPGIPITGKLNSSENFRPPVKEPSPPITTKPSISLAFILLKAFALPDFVLNSSDLAE